MRKPSNDIDGKNKSACPKGKRKLEYADNKQPKLPLTGKLIYLDVKDVRLTKKLETDLKRLGSSVEKFFVKEINYLITSHPRPKQKNEEKFQSADSPAGVSTPSPFNCGPSPSPGAVETKAPQSVTRGKAILQKAQLQKKTSSIIENAEKWKVKIVSVEAALKWIVKELAKLPPTESAKINQSANARSCKVKRLRSPMLKFESSTRQYRPVHGSLDSWPYANVDTPKGTCPFDGTTVGRGERSREERGDRIGLAQQMENNMPASPAGIGGEDSGSNKTPKVDTLGKSRPSENQGGCFSGTKTVTAGEMRRRKEQKRLQERKRGYCECCQIKYDDLDKHVYQDQHKAFIRDKKNYETLDNLIVTGRSTAHFLQRVLLRHCTKKNLADDKSESEEEVMLITPGKSAAKTKAGEKKILQGKSPSKGRQPQVRIVCSVQESKELKKNPGDSKPEAQLLRGNMKNSKPVSARLGENSGESKKNSERLRGNSGDSKPVAERLRGNSGDVKPVSDRLTPSTSKNDNSDAIDLKHTDIEVQKKDSVNQKDSKLKVSCPAILNTAKMKVDCSPDKRSCTSEGLDMKNHVVPVRTRNSLGVYPNMSPSRVSWARRQSMSGVEDSLIGSDKPSKASCVRTLDSSRQVDTAVENKSQENQRNKHNKKLSDRENKIDSPLPGDRIRVLRESRTRSKQTSPCSQRPESSPRTRESVRKILPEVVKDNADEVDGDVPYKPTRKVSIVEDTRIVSPSRHKRFNAEVVDVEQPPRRQRQCRSQTKAVEEVEGESIDNICNKEGQLDSCLVKDSTTVKTRNRSPVKSTHSHSNTKVDLHETKDSPSTRIRHLSPEKDRLSKSKNKLESTTTRTIDSPVKDTKSLRKTDLQHSQVKDVRSPRSRSHSLGKVSKVESTHVNVSVTTRTRSQSPTRNVHCHSEAEEIDETTTPRRKKRSCVKDAARGSAAENQTTGENDEDKGSVQVDLNSPRLRRKLVVGQSEEKIEEKFEKCKNVMNSTEKCTKNQLVNDEPLSPRKRMRSRESNSTKDSQIGKMNAVNSVIKEDITSGKIVPKRNTVSESSKSSQNREKRSDIVHAEKNFKSPVDLNEERKSPYVDPVVSSALMINSMEEGFYVNCMEMVKKRSQMRQAAQKLKNADNPLGSGSIVASRLDGTPRKKITVTVSPVKSDKSVHQRPKISASIIQRENRSIIKTHSNSPANTQSAISSNDRKNNTNLVKISLGKSDRNSRVHVRKEEDLSSQGSASSKTHPDSRRHHRTRNESRENEDTGRSPSPLFNRSPKYNKSRKSMDKHRWKSHSRGRKNAECDPYDIENLSPLKPGENVIKSPRSGYSGETLRSKKKNRNWRPQQKQLLQGKSSSSKKLQKLKLPDPTQEIKPQEDENTESNSACENQRHRNKNNTNITENVSQHLHKPSEKDKHSCSRRQSARQKLELDDLRGETVCSVASENTQCLAGSLDKTGGDNSKKLKSRDLVLKDGETVSCGDQYSQRKRNVMSPKHRKRKNSHSDSGVGSSKDRIKKGHDRKNSDSTLKWQTAVEPSSPKAKTVKLNKSWTLLSDRSMAKILQSEEEDVPFEGFQPEHATGASLLGSEVSYVETTEVELDGNSNHEWQLDNDEGVDEEDTSNENEFNKYANLNDTFTSPGKRTDSSWDETFDNYIDIQLNRSKPKEANVSTTFNDIHSSPRIFNSPRRQRNLQRGLTPNKRKAEVADLSDLPPEFLGFNCTPKRRKFQRSNLVGGAEVASVEAIDEDIEFNYCSPQKLKELRKPAGAEVVISSSPVTCRSDLFTSTPHASRQNMKTSRYNSLDLPALSDHEPQNLSESDNPKAKSGQEGHKTKTSSSQNDSDKQTNKSRKHRHKSRCRHENKH